MLQQEREKHPIAVVDGGLSLNKPGQWPTDAAEQEQRRIKARLIAESWALGGIDAIAVGGSDWDLGAGFVREIVDASALPLLAANLLCGGEKPYPGAKVLDLSGKRVGFVGITVGEVEGCEVTEPASALREAVAELGQVDVTIGLVPYDDERRLIPLLTDGNLPIDIVLDARGKYVAAGPEKRGPMWTIGSGTRAKSLGVLELDLREPGQPWVAGGQEDRLRQRLATIEARVVGLEKRIAGLSDGDEKTRLEIQLAAYRKQRTDAQAQLTGLSAPDGNVLAIRQIDLEKSMPEHPKTAEMVETAKLAIQTTVSDDPSKFVPRIVAQGPYAGGEACVGCHQAEHNQWSRTPHARAWQSLVAQNSALDAECWSCHVTGAKLEGGPQTPADTAGYRDVQCEACHGPSRAHVAEPLDPNHAPVVDPEPSVCTTCHDGRQDGGRFDFGTYRPQVVHQP